MNQQSEGRTERKLRAVKISSRKDDPAYVGPGPHGLVVDDATEQAVARFNRFEDAALFVAAPDLLEALKEAADWLNGEADSKKVATEQERKLIRKCRAALSNTGETA